MKIFNKKKVPILSDKKEDLIRTINASKGEILAMSNVKDNIVKVIKGLELKEISLGNDIVRVQSTLDDMNVDKADKDSKLKELNNNISKKLKDYLAIEESIKLLSSDYLKDKAELELELEQGREYHKEEMKVMVNKVKILKDEVNDLTASKELLDDQIKVNNGVIETSEETNKVLSDLTTKIKEKNDKLFIEIKVKEANLDKIKRLIEERTLILDESGSDLDTLTKKIETRNTVNEKLKKENEELEGKKLTVFKREKEVEEKAVRVKKYYEKAQVNIKL